MSKLDRRYVVMVAASVIASAVLCGLRFDSFQVGGFSDDAHYIVLAESLARGNGFRLISLPQAPAEWAFPPGWPLLLAPLTLLYPGNYTVLKLLSCLLWLGSIPLFATLCRTHLSRPMLALLIMTVALNAELVGAGDMVMAESAYLFFTLATLVMIEGWEQRRGQRTSLANAGLLIAASLAAFYSQLVRTVGFSMLLAVLCYLAMSRHFRALALVSGVSGMGLVIQLVANSHASQSVISPGYQAQVFGESFADKISHVAANAISYADTTIANMLFPVFGPQLSAVLDSRGLGFLLPLANLVVLLLLIVGAVSLLRTFRLGTLYVVLYSIGVLSFWNPAVGSAQSRFLIPIVPFLLLYLLVGVRTLTKVAGLRNDRRALLPLVLIATVLAGSALFRNIQDWRDPIRTRITDLAAGADWIREHSGTDSVIMAQDPVPRYLYTRRITAPFPRACEELDTYLHAFGVDYVLVSPKLQTPRTRDIEPWIEDCLAVHSSATENDFTVVYYDEANNVQVLRVDNSGGK